jgi:hypothetical protein
VLYTWNSDKMWGPVREPSDCFCLVLPTLELQVIGQQWHVADYGGVLDT